MVRRARLRAADLAHDDGYAMPLLRLSGTTAYVFPRTSPRPAPTT
ncbi:hypothetical protein [Streptomyces rubradiris]|nr:hypothetical protein [Streptomyces rubradiris]